MHQLTRNKTASPYQDPGIWWSPTCQTQTCWEHSGPPRAKDMSKGIVGRRILSQYRSSHTGGSSHRPLPPACSQSPGLATGLCTEQENSSPSPLPSHVLPSLKAGPSWSLSSQSQPPWLTARDVKGHSASALAVQSILSPLTDSHSKSQLRVIRLTSQVQWRPWSMP